MNAINGWTWVRTGVNIAMVCCLLMAGYFFAQPGAQQWLAYGLLVVGVTLDVGLHVALWLEIDAHRRRRR